MGITAVAFQRKGSSNAFGEPFHDQHANRRRRIRLRFGWRQAERQDRQSAGVRFVEIRVQQAFDLRSPFGLFSRDTTAVPLQRASRTPDAPGADRVSAPIDRGDAAHRHQPAARTAPYQHADSVAADQPSPLVGNGKGGIFEIQAAVNLLGEVLDAWRSADHRR